MLIAYIISFIVIAFACGLVVGWMIEKAMVEERIRIIEDRASLLSSMVNYKNNELEKSKDQQMGKVEE